MIAKNVHPKWSDPLDAQIQAFQALAEALVDPRSWHFQLRKDASFSTHIFWIIRMVCYLQQDDEQLTNLATIGYWSRTLTDVEPRYSSSERECLAVISFILTIRPYI